MKFLLPVILVIHFCQFNEVSSHGRLIDPPGRGTAWRYGFNTPPDYTDNENYCGGFNNEYQSQGGKCGVCGDPYQGPRKNECPDGQYCKKVIVKTYKTGQVIEAKVELTANHMGNFVFRICPVTDENKEVTQDCLNQHELKVDGSNSAKYNLPNGNPGIFTVKLALPSGMTCNRCVFQWDYHTANSWGSCGNGSSAEGCGNQEEFRACADVKIGNDVVAGTNPPSGTTTTNRQTQTTGKPAQTTARPSTSKPQTTAKKGTGGKCHSLSNDASLNTWCVENCAAGYCPDTVCTCN